MDSEEEIKFNKILIINLGGIGDVLLSAPALRALKASFPGAKISILVVPRVYAFVRGLAYIDAADIFYRDIWHIFSDIKVLLKLRKEHFDLAINMRTLVSKRSAEAIRLMLNIVAPKLKAGRDTDGRGYFFDIKIPETLKGQKYEMEYDIDTVKALGAEVLDRNIDLKIDEENTNKIELILAQEGVSKAGMLIGVHPGGGSTRRWSVENFSKVINAVGNKTACKFVITGGKDEIGLANKLARLVNTKVVNLSGKLNFPELVALIKRCDIFISNDTGPMHIAVILKTPLVAIFGAGDIIRFDPRNISDKAIVLYKKVECAPCEKFKCADLKCLKIITPGDAVEAALSLLDKKNA